MTDKKDQDELARRFLAADEPISAQDYEEYRMQLEAKLAQAEVMERRARWTTIALWIAALLNMFLVVYLANVWHIKMPEWYGAAHAVLVIASWVELIFYFLRYRPRLARAKEDRQMMILQELNQKVTLLSRRFDEMQTKPQPS